jgi:phage recombination protein Bet
MNTTAVVTTNPQHRSLVTKMAGRFGVDSDKLLATLKATAFRQRDANKIITNEQMMALLVVADQYGLNPFTKEIYAFEDKGAIIPVVGVDGWNRIVNEHKAYDGVEFRYSETMATMPDGKPCPEWCEAVMYRTDRTRPIVVREYLDEVYIGKRNNFAGPWQTHTKRMLRWKALIQGARIAFGFAGIYDEDEAGRIIDSTATIVTDHLPTGGGQNAASLAAELRGKVTTEAEDAQVVDDQPEPASVGQADTDTGELSDLQRLVLRFQEAATKDALDELCSDVSLLPKEDRKAAMAAYDENVARLEASFGKL